MKAVFRLVAVAVTAFSLIAPVAAHAIVGEDRPLYLGEAVWTAQLLLDYPKDSATHCSGALISPRFVLTAAHCVRDTPGLENLVVRIGHSNVTAKDGFLRRPVAVVYHQKFDDSYYYQNFDVEEGEAEPVINLDGDIALLMLDRPIYKLSPVKLAPTGYVPVPGWRTYGWGDTGPSGEQPAKELLTAAQDDATEYVADEFKIPVTNWLAATHMVEGKNTGTCYGDSGGPLVDGAGLLIGLTNFSNAYDCFDPEPTIFAKVSSYRRWIYAAGRLARAIAITSNREDPSFPYPISSLP